MKKDNLPHNHHQIFENKSEAIPKTKDFQTVADIFKQLGDGSRIRIFWLLCHCEECVINLSSLVDMSSPAVSSAPSTISSPAIWTDAIQSKSCPGSI